MFEESSNHWEVLKQILKEKGIRKTEFAISIGYTKNNYTNSLNKAKYSEKMIEKISTALGVEPSVFHVHAPITGNIGTVTQTISLSDRVAELESRLRDKDKLIAHLEKLLADTQ